MIVDGEAVHDASGDEWPNGHAIAGARPWHPGQPDQLHLCHLLQQAGQQEACLYQRYAKKQACEENKKQ